MRLLRRAGVMVGVVVVMLTTLYLLDTVRYGHLPLSLPLSLPFQPRPSKMLIYVCNQSYPHCAGWSDRQRAITTLFLLATVTERRFGIIMDIPCNVRHFYQPNLYDWIVDPRALEGKSKRLIGPVFAFGNETVGFNQLYPEDVILVQTNKDRSANIVADPQFRGSVPDWAKQEFGWRFRDGWTTLMKPTPALKQRVDDFFDSLPFRDMTKPFLGVHVRMGKNPSNPRDGTVFNSVSKLGPLWAKLDTFVRNGSHLFLATDSGEVREMSRKRYGPAHHDTGGVILHSGHHVSATAWECQGFQDALLDQLILSRCDVLFRSMGGFSLKAFYLGKKKEKMFVVRPGSVVAV